MGREKQELQKLYSFKEKNENLLANLENLKSTGSLPEEQYNSIKSGYVKSINDATTAVDQIKTALFRFRFRMKRRVPNHWIMISKSLLFDLKPVKSSLMMHNKNRREYENDSNRKMS